MEWSEKKKVGQHHGRTTCRVLSEPETKLVDELIGDVLETGIGEVKLLRYTVKHTAMSRGDGLHRVVGKILWHGRTESRVGSFIYFTTIAKVFRQMGKRDAKGRLVMTGCRHVTAYTYERR